VSSPFIFHPSKVTRTQRQIEQYRQGDASIDVHDAAGRPWAGVPVWVEQETHAFPFGGVVPDLKTLSETDRQRCEARLNEVFNWLIPTGQSPDPGAVRVDVPEVVHLGRFRRDLDRLTGDGRPLDVNVRGRSVGLGSRPESAAAEQLVALYALCFAHPAVRAIVWTGFWDGEPGANGGGLLRSGFAPKPAFRYLQKLIGTVWHTRASGETDREGRFRFRGYYGDYRVAARVGEEGAATAVFLLRNAPGGGHFVLRWSDAASGAA
jgi:hypothetical protein